MNREINISVAGNRKSTYWKQEKLLWYEFIDKLKIPTRSTETLEEYLKFSKSRQNELKDVGGFVGGALKNGIRKNTYLLGRDIVTLDLDNIEAGKTKNIIDKIKDLKISFVIYSTRKHTEYNPRLRVIFLTDRTMSADEYEPVSRKIAQMIGIELCDPTTFEPVRLMFYPSCSKDSNYIYEYDKDSPCINVDGVLSTYKNWKDIQEWPKVPGSENIIKKVLSKQENPLEKNGVIGAFCKSFSIGEAVEKFIPDVYEISDDGLRMTYTEGSTFGGVVIYDDVFAYSHHATDPVSGKLCNAFDLVRIHKFGDLDDDSKDNTPVNKLPSFVEMSKFARGIKVVSDILNKERYNAKDEFDALENNEEVDISWMDLLDLSENGAVKKTINNVLLVLENDPKLKNKFSIDEFCNRPMVRGKVPWNAGNEFRQYEEVDDSGIRNYLEKKYGLTGKEKINDGLLLASSKRKFNSVKNYLENIKWDNVPRIETLLVDYLGAEDTIYTREVMRASLVAAVARAIDGGVKYDYMPIFTGPQGIGKSTFLAKLGGEWYSDSLLSFEGKEAAEMIQGIWINEIGELTTFTKSETNLIKQFLSKTHDIYRKAYGKQTEKYPRRGVFFGTSNDSEFLRDRTGNRRFWPVEVGKYKPSKSIWIDLDKERDQIWAEAYFYYVIGSSLDLSKQAMEIAFEKQETYRIKDVKEGEIEEFLDKKIPKNWHSKTHKERRDFYNFGLEEGELVERDRVCAVEILVECFGMKTSYIKNSDSMNVNSILANMKGWEPLKYPLKFGDYGQQRGYKRKV